MSLTCPRCHHENPDTQSFCGDCGTQLPSLEDVDVTETLETPFPQFLPGTYLSDRYEIVEVLGKGGMGEVYRAEDTSLKRHVAIKVLPQEFALDKVRLARFEREARLLASLNHPNIATIHGLERSNNQQFLVMELVEGETLAEMIKRGPQTIEDALDICRQIAEGLESAHDNGIIHRDLKPANVKVTPDGNVKILDFGIAKVFQEQTIDSDPSKSQAITDEMTQPGMILGTSVYMSPEQSKGDVIDKKTDIWAFGCILYEVLTGKRAFEKGTISETIAAILKEEPDWDVLPSELPPLTGFLLRRCLQKNPKKRLHDIADARIEIEEAFQENFSPTPTISEPNNKIMSIHKRKSLLSYLLLAVIVAVVTGIAVWSFMKSPEVGIQPNVTPVIVLMDSPIPVRVYDPETRKKRGTNADDLTDILRDFPVVLHKETTSSIWHREDQVLKQNPDLILIHRSCFYDATNLSDENFALELYGLADSKLIAFLGYIAQGNPNTKFLVYSRGLKGIWDTKEWTLNAERRFPSLKGRIISWRVPGKEKATFRDPNLAKEIKGMVKSLLSLEE
jgi:serine/threonine protein kinase